MIFPFTFFKNCKLTLYENWNAISEWGRESASLVWRKRSESASGRFSTVGNSTVLPGAWGASGFTTIIHSVLVKHTGIFV